MHQRGSAPPRAFAHEPACCGRVTRVPPRVQQSHIAPDRGAAHAGKSRMLPEAVWTVIRPVAFGSVAMSTVMAPDAESVSTR